MQNNTKKTLREKLLKERGSLEPEHWHSKSIIIQERVLELAQWRQATSVLLYTAFRQEVDTALLLEDSLKQNRITLLPRCLTGSKCIELAAIKQLSQLKPGAYGIAEPDPTKCPQEKDCSPGLVLLPGVGFDTKGFRLGYGGGYYDRLLASCRLKHTLRIGLAFDLQLLGELPVDPWDKPVDAICTEKQLLWI